MEIKCTNVDLEVSVASSGNLKTLFIISHSLSAVEECY